MKRTHVMIVLIVVMTAALFLIYRSSGGGGDNPADNARQAVEAQGYTNLQYDGIDYFACGNQASGFAFYANNVNDARVRVVACNDGGVLNPLTGWRIVVR